MYNIVHVANRSTKDLPQHHLNMTPNTLTSRSHVLWSSDKLSWTPNCDLGWVEACATQHLARWKHSHVIWLWIYCAHIGQKRVQDKPQLQNLSEPRLVELTQAQLDPELRSWMGGSMRNATSGPMETFQRRFGHILPNVPNCGLNQVWDGSKGV